MMQPTETPWYVQFFKADYLRVYGHTLQQDRTDLETQFAIHALGLQPNNHVLDLCCGQGRHSIALAKTGLSVTGIDLSEEMLRLAHNNAVEEGIRTELFVPSPATRTPPPSRGRLRGGAQVRAPGEEGTGGKTNLSFHQADMRNLPDEMSNRFDTVINMFSSFGYLESEQDDQQVLHQIHKVLKPGGKLLMDLLNREWVIINNEEFDWHQHQDGRIVLERRQLDLATSTNHLTYTEILPDGTRNQLSNLKMRLYTLTELTKMLTTANLTLQTTYGTFNAEPYTKNTRRMIVIAQKST